MTLSKRHKTGKAVCYDFLWIVNVRITMMSGAVFEKRLLMSQSGQLSPVLTIRVGVHGFYAQKLRGFTLKHLHPHG